MAVAPVGAVPVILPLLVDVEQGEVVALWHKELLSRCVRFLLPVLGPKPDGGHGQHRDDGEDLVRTLELLSLEQHLRQRRVHGKLHHLGTHPRQAAGVIQRAQDPQLVHAVQDVILRGWVHKVKVQEVLHVEGLEKQHHVPEVSALNLRHRHGEHLVLERHLRVQPVARARSGTTRATLALVNRSLGARENLQRVHAHPGVIDAQLAIARVHDVHDAVQRERSFGNVGGHHALPNTSRSLLEDLRLQIRRQLRVDG